MPWFFLFVLLLPLDEFQQDVLSLPPVRYAPPQDEVDIDDRLSSAQHAAESLEADRARAATCSADMLE